MSLTVFWGNRAICIKVDWKWKKKKKEKKKH